MVRAYTGENDALRVAAVRNVVADFVAQYTDLGLERLDGEESLYDRIVEAVQSIPFLVDRKLVVVTNASLNKEFTERFDEFLDSVSEGTDVLLVEGKLDKRTTFYKSLQKKTEFTDFKILDANGLVRFAGEYAQQQGGEISTGDARYLIERVGLNQQTVQNEIDKLVLYEPKITKETIDLLTEKLPQSRVFDLLDAAFSGNIARTLELYRDQRAQGVEPQLIVGMLVWQLYIFALVKTAHGRTVTEIAKQAKLNPFVVEKSQNIVRKMSLQRLRGLISELRELDVRSKTEGVVLDDALQHFLLSIG